MTTMIYAPPPKVFGSAPVDKKRCRASVRAPHRGVRRVQCSHRGTKPWTDPKTGEEYLFCGTHHPDKVAERDKARQKAWQEKWDDSCRQSQRAQIRGRLADATIAAFGASDAKPPVFSDEMCELVEQLFTLSRTDGTQ